MVQISAEAVGLGSRPALRPVHSERERAARARHMAVAARMLADPTTLFTFMLNGKLPFVASLLEVLAQAFDDDAAAIDRAAQP